MKKFLLICLIVIVTITAISLGMKIYKNNLVKKNREAVIEDLKEISNQALAYYHAPLRIGGGGNQWVPKIDGEYQQNRCALWLMYSGSFIEEKNDEFSNENGKYKLWLSSWEDNTLKILGTGIEIGKDRINPVQVRLDLNGPAKGESLKILN